MKKKLPDFERGSGNVFADLGLDGADELFMRAQIGFCVHRILTEEKLKQREIASLLGIAQPDVSHLMNGHYSRFAAEKLLEFLRKLNRKVAIHITPHRSGEPWQQVSYAP